MHNPELDSLLADLHNSSSLPDDDLLKVFTLLKEDDPLCFAFPGCGCPTRCKQAECSRIVHDKLKGCCVHGAKPGRCLDPECRQ